MPSEAPEQAKAIDSRIREIGEATVSHVNSGTHDDSPLWNKYWDQNWLSVEGDGSEYKGRAAIDAKCEWWANNFTVHSCKAEGPYLGTNGFAVKYTIDCEAKDGSFPRMTMSEIAQYTVEDGKVVREDFMGLPRDC